ncbi:MAG: PhzF family phenazine biosynthesis protein [Hyphomicrobiaceae bacterium]|jgi:trans-2,3-dihydro-3-hydroxyanthranilate isomerase
MRLTYHVLDVFTEERFGGNPLAVVLGADALDGKQMQTIAREFNLSETVFVLKAQNPAHSARVRIFTPATELPFAGHPTVGTAVLLESLRQPADGGRNSIVVLEERIGAVRIGVTSREGQIFAEFDAPKLPEETGALAPPDRLAAALGLIPGEVGFENHKPMRLMLGPTFAFVPVSTLAAMEKAHVTQHWESVLGGQGLNGAFLYCRQTVHSYAAFHARMFAPEFGIAEDPATGSACAAFAGAIHRFDRLPDGLHKRVVEQGLEMGRPSFITISMEVKNTRLEAVRIGGHAVRIAEGTIEV